MGLETATRIDQLNPANPVGAVDPKSQGDDHIRMIKTALLGSFPNITGVVTASHTQLNTAGASGVSGFAVPSVKVDLAAGIAGVATTALRSDAKLQLDQAIAPTWTGRHTFGNGVTNFQGTQAELRLIETDQPADQTTWRIMANGSALIVGPTNDAVSAAVSALNFTRTAGAVLSNMTFGNATNNPTYTFAGTGAMSIAGSVSITGTLTATGQSNLNGNVRIDNAQPSLWFNENDQGADAKLWDITAATTLRFRTKTDADAVGSTFLQVARSGSAASSIAFAVPLITAAGIHNGTATGTTEAIASGTWSPTFTNVANTSALTQKGAWAWSRTGNVVTFSGQVDYTPAALVRSAFRVSLPIASNFTAQHHATGFIVCSSGTAATGPLTANGTGLVTAVAATDDLLVDFFEVSNTTAKTAFVQGQYQVL